MAIVLKKVVKPPEEQAPVAAVEAAAGTSNEVAALIDKIGLMQPEVDKIAARIKVETAKLVPYKLALKQLTELVTAIEGHEPEDTFTQEGEAFEAKVGKQTKVRLVMDVKQAIALLNKAKKDVAYEVVSVPLGKIDQYLTPDEATKVLKVVWGERSVAISKRAALAKAA
jgi:hypothetical protein